MGAFDDLIPAAGPESDNSFSDLIPQKRKVGAGEAAARGVGSGFAEQGNVIGLAAGAPFVLADAIQNIFRKQPSTAAKDFYFSNVYEPVFKRAVENYEIDPQREEIGPGATLANVGGRVSSAIPLMIASGGASQSVMLPKIVSDLFRAGVAAQPAFVVPATVNRSQQLLEAGVDPETVAKASAVNFGTNTALGVLPGAIPGRLFTRAASGAAVNAAGGAAQRAIEGRVLGKEYEKQAQPAFGLKENSADALLGAAMASLFGPRARAPQRALPAPKPGLELAPVEPRQEPAPASPDYNPAETIKGVNEALFRVPEGAPQPPRLQLIPKGDEAPAGVQPTPDVSEVPVPVPPEATVTGQPRQPAREPGYDARGQEIPLHAEEAFRVAESQRERKQGAQDVGDGRDLREARAGGTTSIEGTQATAPQAFTFLDVRRGRDGRPMSTGPEVKIESEVTVKDAKGKDVPGYRVSYMRDLEGGGRELVYEDVPQTRVSELSRPYNPRFAQDIAATAYQPPRGVGVGEQQPKPREAAQRITTEPSPDVIPAARAERGEEAAPTRRVGEDVTDLAFDRIENRGGDDARVSGTAVARTGGQAGDVRQPGGQVRLRGDEQHGRDARQPDYAEGAPVREDARAGQQHRGEAESAPHVEGRSVDETDRDSLAAFEQERDAEFKKGVAEDMRNLAKGSGWAERGGLLIRHKHSDVAGDETISRTKWLAAEWFSSMRSDLGRKGLNERGQIMLAVEKWLEGEKMTPNERRTVNYMLGEVMDLRDQAEFTGIRMDRAQAADIALANENIERTPQNLYDVDYLSRVDPDVLERLAIQHGDDTEAFMRAAAQEVERGTQTVQAKPDSAAPAVAERPGEGGRAGAEPEPRAAGADSLAERGPAHEAERVEGVERGDRVGAEEGRGSEFRLEQPDEQQLRLRDSEQRRVAEEQRQRENAPAPEDFTLTGSDRAADQAEARGQKGLFDQSGPGTLSVNPFANIGQLANELSKAWHWAVGDAKTWTNKIAELTKDIELLKGGRAGDARNVVRKVTSYLFDSAAGDMRAAIKATGDSKTATEVMDKLHNRAGDGKATGETLHDAVRAKVNQNLVKLHELLGDMIHNDAEMKQVAALVRNPEGIRKGTRLGDAADGIRTMLADTLKYMREAGVDVGEVKGGYYPREFDIDAIMRDPRGFVDAAARAYRDGGMTPEAALMAARELHDGMLYGETDTVFKTERGAARAPFLKGRLFGKEVDQATHPLNKYLISDPSLSLAKYFDRAAKRAEIARRFGDNFANWPEITKKIREEGGGDILQKLSEYVALDAGLKNVGASPGMMRASSIMRTWGALSFLEKATLSSLTEFMVPAIRSGNVADIGRMFKNTMADLFNKHGDDAAQRRKFAEDLGLISGHISSSLASARFAGGEPLGRTESKVLDAFFKRTGLNQWTDATRVGAADNARVFIRRLAKDMQEGGNLTQRYLAELGVPTEQSKDFAKYVLSKNDGLPVAGDLTGAMGETYRTALRKFVSQSIMDPTHGSRPKWMSHPMGAVIGQLQAFNYAFYENVWKRNMRLAKSALTDADYTAAERAQMLAPTMMLPLVTMAAYAIGEGRDAVFGDPRRRAEETGGEKVLKAVSRGTPFAPIDPLINYLSSARYSRTATESFAGPALGTFARAIDATRDYFLKNSEKTNTQERRALRAAWDILVEPTINLALYATPSAKGLQLAAAAVTQLAGSATAREKALIEPLAGPQAEKKTKPKDGSSAGRDSGRGAGRTAGRS